MNQADFRKRNAVHFLPTAARAGGVGKDGRYLRPNSSHRVWCGVLHPSVMMSTVRSFLCFF